MSDQTPTLDRVEITVDKDGEGISVFPYWKGVDRPKGAGWGLRNTPRDHKLARRLKAALEAGVVYRSVSVGTDVNGNTYASTEGYILGRRLNADLTRLGF
jgi:hypothetical protein